MNYEDVIIDYINQKKLVTKKDLKKRFKLENIDIDSILDKLEHNLNILEKNGIYSISQDDYHKIGVLKMSNEAYGFVSIDDNDIYVAKENLNGALNGDTVLVEIMKDDKDRLCAHVLKKKDSKKKIVGIVVEENNNLYIEPINKKYSNLKIKIDRSSGVCVDNQVLVTISNNPVNGIYEANLEEILGYKNDPGIDILSVLKEKDVNIVFPNEITDELKEIPFEVNPDEIVGRIDLRELTTFTIDGADAKDFDDAVSIKKLQNGNYELGVHIADVSHYVKENSAIDLEARERGTSIYLADRVIPMLPPKLSNGICSLNPNVDRLTITYLMRIDSNGNITNYDVFESVINSHKRMKYNEANEVLNGNIISGYEDFEEHLNLMHELAIVLRKNRFEKGSLDLDIPELKLKIDDNGNVVDIVADERGESERIIEEFMLAANRTAAQYATNLITHIFRNHDVPDEISLHDAKNMIKQMGYSFNYSEKNGMITSRAIEESLEKLKNEECYHVIATIVLRSLKKANYSIFNNHHFALSALYYAHNTSPIRRYPDLMNQRLFKSIWYCDDDLLCHYDEMESRTEAIARLASLRERIADECEREVNRMKSAEYLSKFIGDDFNAVINNVSSKGMGIQLDNQIEGNIPLQYLKGYKFDNEKFCLKSLNGKCYKLGQQLNVKLIKSIKETRKIEFIPNDEDCLIEDVKKYVKK